MHSKAKTYSEVTVLQVVGKSYDSVSGRLKGLSMSDGCIVSHNVVPNNHAAAEQMNEFKRFDLIQVKAARMKKDLLILDDVDLFEVSDKAGNPFQITRHILGQGVAELRQLRQENLDLWGVQFPVGRAVQFNCKTTSADPNATTFRKWFHAASSQRSNVFAPIWIGSLFTTGNIISQTSSFGIASQRYYFTKYICSCFQSFPTSQE